ncbi:hypothetical protein BDR03DRAFT_801203, partial [Suillus americanus]
ECSAEHLWDNVHATISKQVNKQLLVQSSDKPLCVDWQQGCGCTNRPHDKRHLCSGCLSASHSAQYCPRTQAN